MNYLRKHADIFYYLLALTCFFIFIEISYFITVNRSYIAEFNSLSNQFTVPLGALKDIFLLIIIQLLLHLVFCSLVWLMTLSLAYYFRLQEKNIFSLSITIWVLSFLTILLANAYYYSNSAFAELVFVLFSFSILSIVFKCLFFITATIFFIALFNVLRCYYHHVIVMLIIGLALISTNQYVDNHISNLNINKKPNIIIIGVDSLRPDFLSFFGSGKATPVIDAFLQQATVFSDALTPLARTFPAWVSILTGLYPKEHGVRTNLAPIETINFSNSLPYILKQQGYHTIYATDEARFSNIDKQFGFNEIITPPMGINDFIIGTLNDFPLSNLLINTKLGSILFPYNYANRASYIHYDPNSFLERLQPALIQANTQPLFLSIHFCLPHYPYVWKNLPEKTLKIQARYQASIEEIDKQLAGFLALLKSSHLLNNTIVVLLSDHGEGLALPGDRITEKDLFLSSASSNEVPTFYPASHHEPINRSAGHGTDVLGLSQYHTLLAFRTYGEIKSYPAVKQGTVSLLSIKPTLLHWLNLKQAAGEAYHAPSLLKVIQNRQSQMPEGPIFIESDFSPDAMLSVHPKLQEVLLEGIKIFKVNPHTLRLSVKPDMYKMIIESKQFANINGNWMLALYPEAPFTYMPILINLQSGLWTNNLRSPFAQLAPAKKMLNQLQHFYGQEIPSVLAH